MSRASVTNKFLRHRLHVDIRYVDIATQNCRVEWVRGEIVNSTHVDHTVQLLKTLLVFKKLS